MLLLCYLTAPAPCLSLSPLCVTMTDVDPVRLEGAGAPPPPCAPPPNASTRRFLFVRLADSPNNSNNGQPLNIM